MTPVTPEGGGVADTALRAALREVLDRGVFDVREWGERGTPYSNGAERAFRKIRAVLDAHDTAALDLRCECCRGRCSCGGKRIAAIEADAPREDEP